MLSRWSYLILSIVISIIAGIVTFPIITAIFIFICGGFDAPSCENRMQQIFAFIIWGLLLGMIPGISAYRHTKNKLQAFIITFIWPIIAFAIWFFGVFIWLILPGLLKR